MSRNYKHVERYLNELLQDIYNQPPDEGHTNWARDVITGWCSKLVGCNTVLDIGCGATGFCQPIFAEFGINWTGITLGDDYITCKNSGLNVYNSDMSFLPFEDESFDLVFARHSLEHSVMPLISLMEWHRVSKQWVCVILPKPEKFTYTGKNHYSIMPHVQLVWLAARAGLRPIWEKVTDDEIRVMFEKGNKKIE